MFLIRKRFSLLIGQLIILLYLTTNAEARSLKDAFLIFSKKSSDDELSFKCGVDAFRVQHNSDAPGLKVLWRNGLDWLPLNLLDVKDYGLIFSGLNFKITSDKLNILAGIDIIPMRPFIKSYAKKIDVSGTYQVDFYDHKALVTFNKTYAEFELDKKMVAFSLKNWTREEIVTLARFVDNHRAYVPLNLEVVTPTVYLFKQKDYRDLDFKIISLKNNMFNNMFRSDEIARLELEKAWLERKYKVEYDEMMQKKEKKKFDQLSLIDLEKILLSKMKFKVSFEPLKKYCTLK